MDLDVINKECERYKEVALTYPAYLFIFYIVTSFIGGVIAYNALITGGGIKLLLAIPIVIVFIIAGCIPYFLFLVVIYFILFLTDSDRMFKILGYNRLKSNTINFLLTFCFLGFLTYRFLVDKVDQINEVKDLNKGEKTKSSWSKDMK